jgi:hypothetical protein
VDSRAGKILLSPMAFLFNFLGGMAQLVQVLAINLYLQTLVEIRASMIQPYYLILKQNENRL